MISNWMVQLFIIIPVSKSLHDCRRVFNLRFLNYQPVDLLLFTYLFLKEHHNGWQPGALMALTWKGSQTGQFFYNHNSQKHLLRGSGFGRCRGQAEKWLSFEVWGGERLGVGLLTLYLPTFCLESSDISIYLFFHPLKERKNIA